MTWMQTVSGRAFDLDAPRPDQVDARDVAYSLSRQARYLGHTKGTPYSVAEHCCVLHDYMLAHHGPRLAFAALLHDASEAYLGDLPSPVKAALGRTVREFWSALTYRVDEAILAWLAPGLEVGDLHHPLVKDADTRVLLDERDALMGPAPRPWSVRGPPLGVTLPRWDAGRARVEWTERLEARQHADHDLAPLPRQPPRGHPDLGVHAGDTHAVGEQG